MAKGIVQKLQRHEPMQAHVLGFIDKAHAAAPDPLEHAVMGNTEFDNKPRQPRILD
jgi:hypothetical protein